MAAASLIISIFAVALSLIIAGFGIFIQFKMYEATNNQLGEMQKLVGELRGLTDRLVQIQQDQFNKMLDAFVTRPAVVSAAASAAAQSASELSDARSQLDSLQGEGRNRFDMEGLQSELSKISDKLGSAIDSSFEAAQLARRAMYGPSRVVSLEESFVILSELDKFEEAGVKPDLGAVLGAIGKRLDFMDLQEAARIVREMVIDGEVATIARESAPPYYKITNQGRGMLESLQRVKKASE